jgi:hypothetical protein
MRKWLRLWPSVILPVVLIALGLDPAYAFGAVTAFWYGVPLKNQWGATAGNRTDWVGNAIKCSLHTSTYAPNQDTDDFFNDATNEITGTGYTAGGVSLANKTLVYDTGTNEVRLDADDAVWTTATFTARYAVVYNSTPGTAATNPLMGYVNFGADQSVSAGNFTIQWDATGVLKVTAA